MARAAIYSRISQDRDGEALGVERQEADCRALAERNEWDVIRIYSDNDASAYSRRPRPAYRQLLQAVERGEVDVILAYRADRLYRRAADLTELIDIVNRHGTQIATVASGEVDLTTADGKMIARIVGSVAEAESERMGERLRRQREQQVEEGRRQGGGSRPFGWTDSSMSEQDPNEAALIREAAEAVLAGESVYSITTRWNAAGITTSGRTRWKPLHLVRTLKRPILAGLRVHARTGTVTKGNWEPIISEDTHQLLLARLESRGNTNGARFPRRTRLLSGLVRCAECGCKLQASSRHRYVCNPNRTGGCGVVTIKDGRLLEAAVVDLSIAASRQARRQRRTPRRTDPTQAALSEMRELDQRAEAVGAMFGAGELDVAAVRSAQRVIEERRAELEAVLRDAGEPTDETLESRGEAFERWTVGDALRPEDLAILQPIIVATLGENIYVAPTPEGQEFSPEQVTLTRETTTD